MVRATVMTEAKRRAFICAPSKFVKRIGTTYFRHFIRCILIVLFFFTSFPVQATSAADSCEKVKESITFVAGLTDRLESLDQKYKNQPPGEKGCYLFIGQSFFENREKSPDNEYLDRAIGHFRTAAEYGNQELRGKAKVALVRALLEQQKSLEYTKRQEVLFEAFEIYDDIKNAFFESREVRTEVQQAIQTHLNNHRANPLSNTLDRAAFLPICRQLKVEQSLLPEKIYGKISEYTELTGQAKTRENVGRVQALLQGEIGRWVAEEEKRTYEWLAGFYTLLDQGISADSQNHHSQAASLYKQAKANLKSSAVSLKSDSHLAGKASDADCRQNRSQHYSSLSNLLPGSLKPTGSKDLATVQKDLQTITQWQKTINDLSQACQLPSLNWTLFNPDLEELATYYNDVISLLGPNNEPDFLSTYYIYAPNQHYKNSAGLHLARHFYDKITNIDLAGDPELAARGLKAFWRGTATYMKHLEEDPKRTQQQLQKIYSKHLTTISQNAIDAIANIKTPLDSDSGLGDFDTLLKLAENCAKKALEHDKGLDMTQIHEQTNSLTTFKQYLDEGQNEQDNSKAITALANAEGTLNSSNLS